MNRYVIGDVVKCDKTNERLIIIDVDTTKNGNYIYLTSNKLWYDHHSISLMDYSEPILSVDNDDELETMIKEYMKTPNYESEMIDWITEENRKYDEENKPTLNNFFNITKLFKKEKGKHDGMFF